MRIRILLSLALLTALAFPSAAQAACSNPAGVEGEIIMNASFNVPAYCDDTNWIAMKGGEASSGASTIVVPTGLIGYWPLDGDATDAIGSSNGSLLGDTAFTALQVNDGVTLDGSGDYINLGSDSSIDNIAGEMSICLWASKDSGGGYQTLLGKSTDGYNGWDFYWAGGNGFGFLTPKNGYRERTSGVTQSTLHHLCATWDGTDGASGIILYLDGAVYTGTGGGDLGADLDDAANNLFIGGGSGTSFPGDIDDVRLYNRVISPTEITEIYNCGVAGDCGSAGSADLSTQIVPTGLIGHWRLDETSGTAGTDSSGNGYDGNTGINASTSTREGAVGTAIYFNGNNQGIDTVASNLVIPNTSAFTISQWFKASSIGTGEYDDRMFSLRRTGTSSSMILSVYDNPPNFGNYLNFAYSTGGSLTNVNIAPISVGQWYHYLITYDGSNYRVYLDNVLKSTIAATPPPMSSDLSTIGNYTASAPGSGFHGVIDDVRVYNRVLNTNEISELFSAKNGIRYNERQKLYEYFDGNKFVSMKRQWRQPNTYPDGYIPNGVDFDGSTYVRATSIGGSNVTQVSGSFWFKRDTANLGVSQTISHYRNAAGQYFRIRFNTSNELVFDGQEAGTGSFTTVLNSNSTYTDSNWHHVIFSLDSTNRSLDNLYIDGIDESDSTGATIPAFGGGSEMSVGMFGTSNQPLFGSLADFWIDFGNRIDFSVQANRDDFINAQGNAVFLGTDGSIPTGSAPEVFLSGETSSWQTNKGSFSGFTETGTLTESSKKPYRTGGLLGHWTMDETTGTTVYDSSGNGNNGTMTNGLNAANDSQPGAVSTSLAIDGIDDGISIGNPSALNNIFNGGATISGWAYIPSTVSADARLLDKNQGGVGDGWLLSTLNGSNTLSFDRRFSGSVGSWQSTASFPLDQWFHYVLTFDDSSSANNPAFFINGVSSAITESVAPSGSADDDSGETLYIANRLLGGRSLQGSIDDVRIYDRILSTDEIQKLYQMGAPVGSSTALPQGCPNVGDVCDDGTYYAGLSPDGNIPMYAAAEDEGVAQWRSFGNSRPTNNTDGDGNTALLYAFGPVEHPHAYNCFDKVAHGASDWYWPAQNEMLNIYNGGNPIGGVIADGTEYWASNQHDSNSARSIRFNTGYIANTGKNGNFRTRCVRKGPAPRCANPYGLEGQMIYNSTHDVVQFCDGARWIAVGK